MVAGTLRVCVLAGVGFSSFAVLSGCEVEVPSGVFSCAAGERCPPGQTCGPDRICRTGVTWRDASVDSGVDAEADAAHDVDAGLRDAGIDSGDDSGPASGAGGKAGTPAAGTGGAGSGGAAGQMNPAGFHVVSTQPAKDGVLEDLGAPIKVTFSAALDAASVTPGSVQLVRDGSVVDGTLSTTLTEVTFEPEDPWMLAAHYELQLTNAVRDSKDRPLEPYTLGFTTRDGSWQREKRADGTDGVIAASGDGFAALAWAQPGSMYPEIWASQFTPPSTWSSPVQIKETSSGSFVDQIAVNRRHRVAVLYTTLSHNYRAIAYTTGPTWGSDAYIVTTSSNARLLLNESDELVFVADSPTTGDYGILGSRFTLGATSPTPIEVGDGTNDSRPGLALLDGDPRVIWQHASSNMTGAPTQIMSGVLNSTSGTPLSANGVVAANAVLAGDARQASIIAAWEQADPTWTNAWASRMVLGANWSTPVKISDDQSSVSNLALALDPAGRAVAVWRQAGAITSNHFAPATGWSAAQQISAPGAMNLDAPQLVVDAAGNAVAAWTQDGENASLNEVWVARYWRDGGWQAASRARVSDMEAGTGSEVSLTVDDYGRAFVVWTQANQVWSARFE